MSKKIINKTKRRFHIGNFVLLAVICFLLVQFGQQLVKYYDLRQQALQYEEVKEQKLAQKTELESEKTLLKDPSYLEVIARESLGLVKKGEILIVPTRADAKTGVSKVEAPKAGDIH